MQTQKEGYEKRKRISKKYRADPLEGRCAPWLFGDVPPGLGEKLTTQVSLIHDEMKRMPI